MRICSLLLAMLWCASGGAASGGEAPLRENALMLGIGYTDILDTYLSPEKYRGTDKSPSRDAPRRATCSRATLYTASD